METQERMKNGFHFQVVCMFKHNTDYPEVQLCRADYTCLPKCLENTGTKKFMTVWLFSRLLWTPVECWQLAEVYSDVWCYKIQISNNRLGTNTAGSLHQHIYIHYTYLTEREVTLHEKGLPATGESWVLARFCVKVSCVTGSASHVNKVCV